MNTSLPARTACRPACVRRVSRIDIVRAYPIGDAMDFCDVANRLTELAGALRKQTPALDWVEAYRDGTAFGSDIAAFISACSTDMRMAALIDNVLDFARGRLGGGITLDRNARKPLEPVLHQVIDELRLSSPGRQIEAEYAIDRPIDCDRIRIGQLVSNLVGNALSHGSANEPVRVLAETTDGLFKLSVANGGEPIPEAAMDKLFEPFFRSEVRASRQGLGLGLHIASQIAKAHDGVLTVTSKSEETIFTFTMPLR